jgi:hypothetical protein
MSHHDPPLKRDGRSGPENDRKPPNRVRRPYEPPQLRVAGHLASVILGGSPGGGDTGAGVFTQNPLT